MFINTPDRCSECAARGALLAKQLAPLGIDVKVKVDERAPGGFFEPDLPADLVLMGWIYDWPDPSNTLNAMFDRGRPLGYGFPVRDELFDEPAAARVLRAAYQTSGPARDAAYRRADDALLERWAPVVPFARNDQPILVGPRVGCAAGLPEDYGHLNLAALCLK
jgi:ABC-type transport system substrate-binding protein